MKLSYSDDVRRDFPLLASGTLIVQGVAPAANVSAWTEHFTDIARERLRKSPESGFPEVQAWRRAYGAMGFRPTQYRCAAEALLRRLRTDGALPHIHPLVDLCNAVSAAFAIPIAAFDSTRISGDLKVRAARGDERYETIAGEVETPEPGEIIFADRDGRAHARRWVNRQSGFSIVSADTISTILVAEALHETAADDLERLLSSLGRVIAEAWPAARIERGNAL